MAAFIMTGHLKEEDSVINLARSLMTDDHDDLVTLSIQDAVEMVNALVNEHVRDSRNSKLLRYAPDAPPMFLPMDLKRALREYDERTRITHRRFVMPTFKELRHIFNIATVHAVAPGLRMVTFDADDTIYPDGGEMSRSSPIVDIIVRLMRAGVTVSLVTAAGYPGAVERYEQRLRGLLDAFQLAIEMGAPTGVLQYFYVMGGECNYLHRTVLLHGRVRLEAVAYELWKDGRGVRWTPADITRVLDTAERVLRATAEDLNLDISILRKERSVGMIRHQTSRFPYEVLEEAALRVQEALSSEEVPHCAFNGGNDVWVDIGNKALGIRALQSFVHATAAQTLHVGDRFTRTGNDTRTREVSNSVWVSDPHETDFVMRLLLRDLTQAVSDGVREEHKVDCVPSFRPITLSIDGTDNDAVAESQMESAFTQMGVPTVATTAAIK